MKRSFILGLGHQKCGTTWLYKYLCQSESFAQGINKEYHVWDQIDLPFIRLMRRRPEMHEFQQHVENSASYYFSHFDDLMTGDRTLVADITPSYSGLNSERLAFIRQNFLAREIDTKVVILVREPLSRIKSSVRYNLDRKNYFEGISLGETDFEKALMQYYQTKHCTIRTRYEHIISAAKQVFPAENIYLGFYESMFDEDEVRRLSDFLQIDAKVDFTSVKVNTTKSPVSETGSDRAVKEYYADTYRYFYENYPISRKLWGM